MEITHPRCAGLDVHNKTVVACCLISDATGQVRSVSRTFGTHVADLLALHDWLVEQDVTIVALASTGEYWKPIYHLLEGLFELLVVNAQHIKAVPGRKTDVRDAEWIADLLRHGLLRASFVPSAPQRAVRDLTRYRSTVVQDRARLINRLQKVLEDANIKLAGVASNVMGVSARAMLAALLDGQRDPATLAELARGRLRDKRDQLVQALQGNLKAHHGFLLAEYLGQLEYLDDAVTRVNAEIAAALQHEEDAIARLDTIPGVSRRTAEILVAEIGSDLTRFPTAKHLASWAGMCPGNHQSAGKQKHGTTRKGSPWLRQALIEAAHGAARSKDTYLAAQYRRLVRRRGKQRALVATGHSILIIVYYLLTRGTTYQELGANYFDERERQQVERRLVRRLERLGYEVALTPVALAA